MNFVWSCFQKFTYQLKESVLFFEYIYHAWIVLCLFLQLMSGTLVLQTMFRQKIAKRTIKLVTQMVLLPSFQAWSYSWYYLFLIKVLCFTSCYSFYFISFTVNMDNSSKSFWISFWLFALLYLYVAIRAYLRQLFCVVPTCSALFKFSLTFSHSKNLKFTCLGEVSSPNCPKFTKKCPFQSNHMHPLPSCYYPYMSLD